MIIIICLNLPFENKNQLTFYEVRWFKYTFCYSIYSMFEEFLRLCKYYFTNWEKGKNEEDFEHSPAYSLKLKNIILFLNQGLIFFRNGHIRNVVFWRCTTLRKSNLKLTTLFRCCQTFNSILKYKMLLKRC